MSWEFLGSGTVLDAPEIAGYVGQVPDNTKVRLSLDLTASPAAWVVVELQQILEDAGVPGVKVSTGSPILNIDWLHNPVISGIARISMDPLTAVAIIIASLAVIAVVVVGWAVYQDTPVALKPVVVIGGIIVVGLIAYAFTKSMMPVEKVGG